MSLGPARRAATFRAVRALVLVGSAVIFVACADAQWLKLDDFSLIETYRSLPLKELIATIFSTRTMHVRFAFLEQLLLVPWYRWWSDSRFAINVFYVLTVAALLAAGWSLVRPLRSRPASWLGAWLLFLGAIVSVNAWNTLEFKTACYLPLGFALLVLLHAVPSIQPGGSEAPVRAVPWLVVAIAAEHMAEVNLLAVAPLGVALALRRRLRPWVVTAAVCWPLAYWAGNKLLFPRPLGLLGVERDSVLRPALEWAWRDAWRLLRPEMLIVAAVVVLALWGAAWRPGRTRVELLAYALECLGLPLAGLGLLVLTQMNSIGSGFPGYLAERHQLFIQLAWTGGALVALGKLHECERALPAVVATVGVLIVGAVLAAQRLPRMLDAVDARRVELAATDRLRADVQARADAMALQGGPRDLLVFVRAWPYETRSGGLIDPTFLGATWSRAAFSRLYGCTSRRPCPAVTYVPNFAWVRTQMTQAQRAELCNKMRDSEVLVVEDGSFLARERLRAAERPDCPDWLQRARWIDAAEGAQR